MKTLFVVALLSFACEPTSDCTYVFETEYRAEPGECLTLTANGEGTYFQFVNEPEPSSCDFVRGASCIVVQSDGRAAVYTSTAADYRLLRAQLQVDGACPLRCEP